MGRGHCCGRLGGARRVLKADSDDVVRQAVVATQPHDVTVQEGRGRNSPWWEAIRWCLLRTEEQNFLAIALKQGWVQPHRLHGARAVLVVREQGLCSRDCQPIPVVDGEVLSAERDSLTSLQNHDDAVRHVQAYELGCHEKKVFRAMNFPRGPHLARVAPRLLRSASSLLIGDCNL